MLITQGYTYYLGPIIKESSGNPSFAWIVSADYSENFSKGVN